MGLTSRPPYIDIQINRKELTKIFMGGAGVFELDNFILSPPICNIKIWHTLPQAKYLFTFLDFFSTKFDPKLYLVGLLM